MVPDNWFLDIDKLERYMIDNKLGTLDKDSNLVKIQLVTDQLRNLLMHKNLKYGDSALKPKQIFSKSSNVDQICNRLDDKLSRIMASDELRMNDVADLMGYLVLLCISKD